MVSISVWVMNSKLFFCLLAGLLFCGSSPAETTPETFVETSLGVLPPEQKLPVHGETATTIQSILGSRYHGASISYWCHAGKTVWVLAARGKHGLIHAGFVIENNRIVQTEVLSFKEQRGKFIRTSRFLRQFAGAGLKKGDQLDQRIDGYSGATLSVNAMKKMARLALVLDSQTSPEND